MSGGFCSPTTCGFAKVAALYSAKKAKSSVHDPAKSVKSQVIEARYKYFCETFADNQDGFHIDYKTFNKRFLALTSVVRKWNPKKKAEKTKFFTEFSVERWLSLSQSRKNEHTFSNCKGCYHSYPATCALFPVKSLALKNKEKENPFRVAAELNAKIGKGKNTKPGKNQAITVARELFKELNPVFNKWAGISLGEAMTKVPEANVEVKKTPAERKSLRRTLLRSVKEDVERKWQETSLQR